MSINTYIPQYFNLVEAADFGARAERRVGVAAGTFASGYTDAVARSRHDTGLGGSEASENSDENGGELQVCG